MAAYNNNDINTAALLMKECALSGELRACYMMALWLSNEEISNSFDNENEIFWLKKIEKAAQDGNLEAQWDWSCKLRWGNLVEVNIDEANYWLEKAAEGGFGEAQHHLAWYYESGQYGYPIDPLAAQKWYQRAFEQGHPETLYLYATRLFREGRPTEEAIALLSQAADKGFKQAEHVLQDYRH